MGSGIAQVMAIAGHPVVAYDIDPNIVAAAHLVWWPKAGSESKGRWPGGR